MINQTEAIVLKRIDFRETSQIATFFTKKFGKVKGVLKGIRKDHKKFGSTIDKFSVNDIVYYQYRNSDIHLVSQCDLRGFFFVIRQDLKKAMAAHYLVELVDRIMPAEENNEPIYQLMLDFLTALELSDDISKLVHVLQIKILLHSGFRPHLDSCLKCGQTIKSKAKFSMSLGGLVCQNCKLNEGTLMIISQGTVSTILFVEKNSWNQCLRLGMTSSVRKELKYVLNNFLVYHLGRPIRSEKYLQKV
jgi:DNA repair protein RecO (recombination protein O)